MQHDEIPNRWRLWLDEHAGKFLLFARQQTRCEADAEDVLQDALVESWSRCDGAEPPPALVFATIRRRAIDFARSDERRKNRELASGPDHAWFEHAAHADETQRMLEDAVKNLPAIYAEVVSLKIWGDLSFREIAESLGIPQNTAASRYRYGIEALREVLKGVLP